MKKIIYAFLSCCVCQNAFADSPSGVYQNQHVNSILIPRVILQNVLIQDDLISQTPGAVEKMMAKYDQLAGALGQEPLTVNDITQICAASDVITQKDDCLNHVFNPVLAQMGKVRFMNVCSGRITGGNPHCVDDVFVEGKKQNANQYHQDVNVGPYAANGFAIEYAKKKGHDVWCSSEVKDGTVNCTTLDNKEFYSVKFKGTNNTSDTTIEKNLVKGICALFDSKYAIGTFRHQCKMDCAPGSKAREVIQKFGLNVHDGYTKDMHCEIYQPTYTAKDVKTYPGYEYMSRTFKSVQSVLDNSLVEVLKTYVQLQGISVQSFDCEFSPRKYSDEMSNGIPASLDDMLRCQLNGTDVDFIFDDLFEGKEYERRAGQAALQCVLAGGSYGTDRICSGLSKAKCLSPEVQSMVPGGTRWDSKAEVCLLNRAEKARDISNALQVGSGIALAIVFTPMGMPFVGLAAVGLSVATDLAYIGLERLNILEPASRARAFATDAEKCKIPIGSTYESCSQEQVNCAWRVINTHAARLDEIIENLNSDQLSLVDDLIENARGCLSNELWDSAVDMSTLNASDKALNKASAILLVGTMFVAPEKVVAKIGKLPKLQKFLTNRNIRMLTSTSETLRTGAKYRRIEIDNIGGIDDMNRLTTKLRDKGQFYHINLDNRTGRQFLMVSDSDIFKFWDFLDNNFYRSSEGVYLSSRVLPSAESGRVMDNLAKEDFFTEFHVVAMPTKGTSNGEEYRIVALSETDAKALGYINNNGHLEQFVQDGAYNIANAPSQVGAGNALTYIHGKPVYIESIDDIGRHGDRPVILVKCGEQKIPFYASTGTAGKTTVPTGKWEVFGGLQFNGDDGYWFVKGSLKAIEGHYGSPELIQIASALDSKIGDLRDTEYVLETIGRQSMPDNAGGFVGGVRSGLPELDIRRINNYGNLGLGNTGAVDNIVKYISNF